MVTIQILLLEMWHERVLLLCIRAFLIRALAAKKNIRVPIFYFNFFLYLCSQ